VVVDEDGDGFSGEEDCDDNDAAVNPDAEELCDGSTTTATAPSRPRARLSPSTPTATATASASPPTPSRPAPPPRATPRPD
jgi:hypothetical protein